MSENSKKLKFVRIFLVAVLLWSSAVVLFPQLAIAGPAEKLYSKAKKSFYNLKSSAEKMSHRDQWLNTVDNFLEVYQSDPKSYPAYKAIYTVGKLYEGLYKVSKNSKDLNMALGYYGKLIQEFDREQLKDDALYRRGEIYFHKKHYALAEKEFEKIIRYFPKGDRVASARKRLQTTVALLPKPVQITPLNKVAKAPSRPVAKSQKNKTQGKPTSLITQLEKLSPVTGVEGEKVASLPSIAPIKPEAENKVPLVILDPGHGGKDFGARGKHGAIEKDLNLKISKKVKRILEKKYKLRVHLTRSDDTFIPLKERGPIANRMKADLFVSLHANAAKRQAAHGIETYYLGRGLSEQAKETAARENGELVYSIPDDQTQQILADLISNNKMNDSSRLAGRVQGYLYQKAKKRYKTVKNLGVKEGPFWVLHAANMPSILVEVGFVTNAKEEARLKDEKYLNLLAEAVARGIRDFLHENGPMI